MHSFEIGQDRFANEFGGGFPSGSLAYIKGGTGSGKSVISQRLSYGFCQNDYEVSYITPQISTPDLLRQMKSLSYDSIDHLITNKKLNFKPVRVDENKDTESSKSILQKMMNSNKLDIWDSDIIIIDSIGMIARSDPLVGVPELRQFVSNLVDFVSSSDAVVVITSNPSTVKMDDIGIEDNADIYMKLSSVDLSGESLNQIEVVRYQFASVQVSDNIMFTVLPDSGINIDSRSYA